VAVNVDAIKRVRTLCEVNLLEIVEGDLLGRLANDPVLLCDVLYAVCKPELDAKGISDEDFGRAMGGDVIEAATAAFLEEMVGFFPSPKRAVLAKALGKLRVLEERALRAVETRLDDPRLLAEVEKQLAALEVEATPAGG
jgi:hypothetical protein